MIQIRNVPDDLHALFKARAASYRMSLSDYLLEELQELATRPTNQEIFDELDRTGGSSDLSTEDIVAMIREGREDRGQHLDRVLEVGRKRLDSRPK